jgi:hypothetical protein
MQKNSEPDHFTKGSEAAPQKKWSGEAGATKQPRRFIDNC